MHIVFTDLNVKLNIFTDHTGVLTIEVEDTINEGVNMVFPCNEIQKTAYKNSEEYQNSLMKQIQDKLKKFMEDNKYYEIAIPLIRKFSNSYNEYYEKLLKANEINLDTNK